MAATNIEAEAAELAKVVHQEQERIVRDLIDTEGGIPMSGRIRMLVDRARFLGKLEARAELKRKMDEATDSVWGTSY